MPGGGAAGFAGGAPAALGPVSQGNLTVAPWSGPVANGAPLPGWPALGSPPAFAWLLASPPLLSLELACGLPALGSSSTLDEFHPILDFLHARGSFEECRSVAVLGSNELQERVSGS